MAGQYYDPVLLDSIMANLPEVRRRQRRAKKLRKSEERLNKMAEKEISLGGVSKTTHGGLYETVPSYIPNYSGMADKAIGAIGGVFAGNEADEAEAEYDALRDEELLKTARSIGEQRQAEQNPVEAGLAQTMALPASQPPPLEQPAPPAGPPMPPVDVEQMMRGNLQMPQPPQVEAPTDGVPPEIQAANEEVKAQVAAEDLSSEDSTPTEEELRMYMALLDAPKIEGGLSGEDSDNYNISTRVDKQGKIWRFQKYGPPIDTGLYSETKDKIVRGGDGRVWRIVTSGEESGQATEVSPPGLPPAQPGTTYEQLTPEEASAWEAGQGGQTQGGQTPAARTQGSPTGRMKIGSFEIDTGGASEEVMNKVAEQVLAMESYGVPREQIQPVVDAIQRKLLGGGPTSGLSPATAGAAPVAPGGVAPATHPFATPTPAQGRPLTPSDARVAGDVKGAQLDAELDRSTELADAAGRKAAAEAEGKGDVEFQQAAIVELPKMELALNELERDIPNLLNHEALPLIVGDGLWGRLGNVPLNKIIEDMGLAGTPEADVIARLEQMKGQVFLPAFQFLRGGGQITNVEGDKAQAAMGRLNRAQTPEAFSTAMNEFLQAYRDGYAKRVKVAQGEYKLSQFTSGGPKSATPKPQRKAISPEEAARRKALLDEF